METLKGKQAVKLHLELLHRPLDTCGTMHYASLSAVITQLGQKIKFNQKKKNKFIHTRSVAGPQPQL